MMASGTEIAIAVAWIACGVFSTWIGNRTLNRRYPLAGTDGDRLAYVFALFGPASLASMLITIQPWRE